MQKTPIKTIKGPCYIERGAAKFQTKGNVSLSFITDASDFETSIGGKIGKQIEGQRVEVKFTPAEFSRLSDLFPFLQWNLWDSLVDSNAEVLKIYSRSGTADAYVYEIPISVLTGFSAINLGGKTDPLGEFTATGFRDPSKGLKEADALVKEYTVANGWNPPALQSANVLRLPFFGVLGGVAFDFDDGASINFSVSLSDDSNARLGVYDKIFDGVAVSIKFKAKNITEADWKSIAKLYGFAEVGEFVGGGGVPLILRGAKAGDFQFTLNSAEPDGERQLLFSRTDNRFGELTFTSAAGDDAAKFVIGLAEAAFEFGAA